MTVLVMYQGAGRLVEDAATQTRTAERGTGPRQPVIVQAPEVDALFEIDLRMTGRLQRTVPLVMRLDVVGTHDPGFFGLFRHGYAAGRAQRLPKALS